jgi:hypothetical protein
MDVRKNEFIETLSTQSYYQRMNANERIRTNHAKGKTCPFASFVDESFRGPMHDNRRMLIPAVLIIGLAIFGGWYLVTQNRAAGCGTAGRSAQWRQRSK